MKVIDPGHQYLVNVYDQNEFMTEGITFMKRFGENYPGNENAYPGTNCQEVLRVLIDRMKYLNKQVQCDHNETVIRKLRECLWLFEDRAAARHNLRFGNHPLAGIELEPTCGICGHIVCEGH